MDSVTQVQILDEAVGIYHSANILRKCMNPCLFPPVMGKIARQTGLFCLGMATGRREGNSESKTNRTPHKT